MVGFICILVSEKDDPTQIIVILCDNDYLFIVCEADLEILVLYVSQSVYLCLKKRYIYLRRRPIPGVAKQLANFGSI